MDDFLISNASIPIIYIKTFGMKPVLVCAKKLSGITMLPTCIYAIFPFCLF